MSTKSVYLLAIVVGAWLLVPNPVLHGAVPPVEGRELCFGGPRLSVGENPSSVTVADLNADGHADIAVPIWGDGVNISDVAILLGNGDGSFRPPVYYAAWIRPDSVAVGDLDSDGDLDLAVTNYGPDYTGGSVSVLLGNGDGTFQPAPTTQVGAGINPTFALLGDFDADSHLDLVAGNNNGLSGIYILRGRGDGSFGRRVHYNLVGGNPRLGFTDDFDGDGDLDLAVATYQFPSGVSVLLNRGDGIFQPAVNYSAGTNPENVTGADLNADGRVDLAVANRGSDNVSVLMSNGDGTFQPPANYPGGDQPNGVVVADFDSDTRLDLAVSNDVSEDVSILLGNRDGSFRPSRTFPVENDALFENPIDAGDFDGDGRIDLVLANAESDYVSTLLNGCEIYVARIDPFAPQVGR